MPGPVQSVERAAAIVRLLATESEPLGLAQIAGALGLAKPTAHGLLRTLCDVEFVDKDERGRYRVGRDLLQLGSTSLDANELRSRAINWADALAARTGQSVRVAMVRGGEAVIAHHVFGVGATQRQALETGATLPFHATALGKVLLAFDPGAARAALDGPLPALTPRTVTDRAILLRALADVRENGWASSVEESEPGVAGIAAPVRDRGGYVVAAVGVGGGVEALCDGRGAVRQEQVRDVLWAARAISREFGHGRA